jgi:hypothetical protein
MKALLALTSAVHAALTTDATENGEQSPINLTELANTAEVPETDEERAARKARLDRSRELAAKAAGDGTAMPAELLGIAQQEIQVCWKEFADKGGVYDAVKRARKGMANISAHILNIAKACAAEAYKRAESQGPDFDVIKLAGSMFRNALGAAESSLRGSLNLADDEAEAKLDSFLQSSWKVYTSKVRQGFESGLDPKDYDSVYALEKATKAVKEAKATGTRTDKDAGQEGQQPPTEGQEGTTASAEEGEQGAATDADAAGEAQEEPQGDTTPDTQALSDGSEVEIISQGSAKIRGALILLHRAVHGVDIDVDNHEERVTNILRMATREINKLMRDAEEIEQDADEGEEIAEERDLSVSEG